MRPTFFYETRMNFNNRRVCVRECCLHFSRKIDLKKGRKENLKRVLYLEIDMNWNLGHPLIHFKCKKINN
jgi:hypothetical protein